ncbi:Hypothetical protein CpOVI2C_02007 [Corynebacterium pseudotuberculosis]|nr:Hypothetical protein Cp3995_0638 [Corynebacterium pseudotuberculosis 3/99-5]AFH51558.1 Hypothetical protein Cp267_0655 [Corynebacterium pseudotuberculosis 267]AIG07007.1 hypothetical protein CPTA_01178 [Corynebacterium pseudotuberculosis]AIG08410.1 hypothetical protein CPTB_00354 [Corynebacterium pseudotuberculosis]AIG11457.1 hypothetical protein CPTC_01169 [Corynebacterium pseudotuberculosis]
MVVIPGCYYMFFALASIYVLDCRLAHKTKNYNYCITISA